MDEIKAHMTNFTYKDLTVLYEDNHIIVVLKPQNVPSQEDETKDLDMLSAVKQYIKEKANKPGNVYVGLVHRLDRPTGGVMVFAKTSKAAERLCEQMKTGEFKKEYLCITCGVPKEKSGRLVHYLKKDTKNNIVNVVPLATEGAKQAILNYEVKEVVNGYALVKVNLETGRSHQIRVQMATIGCPLYGDQKYGANKETLSRPLALWAVRLTITHPITKERNQFVIYPPTEEAPWKAFEVSRFLLINAVDNPYSLAKEQLKEIKSELDN